MEDKIKDVVLDNYGIVLKDVSTLSGGWMNKKYLCKDLNNNKYVIKLFSSKKVEKMSNGEFSVDYLDNQLLNNLRIENYMYNNQLNCEKIIISNDNKILIPYNDYRLAVINYLTGDHICRNTISNIQLYNLGKECAKMHLLFRNIDSTIYVGNYLKMPTLSKLFANYEEKKNNHTNSICKQYKDLLVEQNKILLLLKETKLIDKIPISVIHGDFADDNILFEGDTPKILDFELVRLNSPLLDIGRILMSYCYDNGGLNFEKIKPLISGYNSIVSLEDEDIFLSFITVWINEVDMWIKSNYFDKDITQKSRRFQDELIFLTNNMLNIIYYYLNKCSLIEFCVDNDIESKIKRRNLC